MASPEAPDAPEDRPRGGSGLFRSFGSAASGAEDYRMLLTVIAGLSLGVAATALPALIEGPFATWLYPAKIAMWLTGIAATVLEYLAVSFGSRLYLVRVELFATLSLSLVFLAQAGMFVVLTMGSEQLGARWFVMYGIFNLLSGIEAEHGRRVVLKHAFGRFPEQVVHRYAASLKQVAIFVLVVGMVALVFAILGGGAPNFVVFVVSFLALGATVAANVQQRKIRDELAQHGII
jgi:hypothetical protein